MKRRERKHDHQELFCIGGTMADIYPGSDWSFVYGLASVDDGLIQGDDRVFKVENYQR
ncbi:unnamed protein product, partial [Rotaria sordida]